MRVATSCAITVYAKELNAVELTPLRSRVGTRPDQMDRPVGVGRVGDVTDRPDFRSENRNWSVGRWSG